MDIRVQKAHLQTTLKSAYVRRDRRIEVGYVDSTPGGVIGVRQYSYHPG